MWPKLVSSWTAKEPGSLGRERRRADAKSADTAGGAAPRLDAHEAPKPAKHKWQGKQRGQDCNRMGQQAELAVFAGLHMAMRRFNAQEQREQPAEQENKKAAGLKTESQGCLLCCLAIASVCAISISHRVP